MKNILWFLIIPLLFFCCEREQNMLVLNGKFTQDYTGKIYLSKVTPNGLILLDSSIVKNSSFQFKVKSDHPKNEESVLQPAFYQLWISPVNGFVTIGRGRETLEMEIDPQSMVKSYTISGGEDAELMWQLDQMLKSFINTIDPIYEIYETHIENDSIREEIEATYQELLQQYKIDLKNFILENKKSLVAIPAFYQVYNRRRFIDEESNLELLQMIYDELRVQFPNHEDVLFLEERIERINRL